MKAGVFPYRSKERPHVGGGRYAGYDASRWRALVSYRGTDVVPESLDQRMYIETCWPTIRRQTIFSLKN